MIKLIDGKKIAEKIKDKLTTEIYGVKGPHPNLAIVLVGERADSKLYVSLKEKEAVKVGIDTHLYKLKASDSEEDLLDIIDWLNKDENIDGILVQLPLPSGFDTNKVIERIRKDKDVDGFHSQPLDYLMSPVLLSIKQCLLEINFEVRNKTACVLYNSDVFGSSIKDMLKDLGFSLLSPQKSSQADLLITALGKPLFIKKKDVKKGATVIDIGITKTGKKVLGDVDIENVKDKVAYITPVPGGIGPMTIAFLFKNTLEIFKRKH